MFFLSEKIRHGDKAQENIDTRNAKTTSNAQAVSTMAASPTLPITVFRPHPDMEIAFDARTRNPCYVVERLPAQHERATSVSASASSDSSLQGAIGSDSKKEEKVTRQSMHFHEEKMLPAHHRSRNSYYKHSGFDRGHLIPSSDFAGKQDAMKATFNLCNISPQNPTFNRKIWGRLEALIRNLAKEEFEGERRSTYVVTGPLWLPASVENKSHNMKKKPHYRYSHQAIGQPPSLVQVPTHFFKVVAVVDEKETERSKSIAKIAVFVLPNEDLTARGEIDLQRYLVRLSDLEAVSGMTFFRSYLGVPGDSTEYVDERGDFNLRSLADALTEDLLRGSTNDAAIVPLGSSTNARPNAASHRRRQRMLQTGKKLDIPMQHLCDSGRCDVVVKATK